MTNWRVALLYNLKHPSTIGADAAPDALAEFAIPETVQRIERALQAAGHEVIPLEADATLLDTIRQTNPDICFNIARGIDGKNRLAQVPALLEMLNIPFTGSDAQGQTLSSDKAIAKIICQAYGLPVAPSQVFRHVKEILAPELDQFPLIVKPLREDFGVGIDTNSIVRDPSELLARVQWIIKSYQEPALVERYLPGREFLVGILGNSSTPGHAQWSDLYNRSGFHILPILEIDTSADNIGGIYGIDAHLRRPGTVDAPTYVCPAHLLHSLEAEIQQLAVSAFEAVGAFDNALIDIRLDEHGQPYLLEIDTLPNLDPHLSDFCLMAEAEGISYDNLINEILQLAMKRNCLLDRRSSQE